MNQGVKAVTCLQGEAVCRRLRDDGLWSWELLEYAWAGAFRGTLATSAPTAGDFHVRRWGHFVKGPIAFHIEYRDGLKATVLQLDGHVADETFAAKILARSSRNPASSGYLHLPGAAFLEALASHIEIFLATGKPPYPVDRTQLTGGILEYALTLRVEVSKRLETPDLDIRSTTPSDTAASCGGLQETGEVSGSDTVQAGMMSGFVCRASVTPSLCERGHVLIHAPPPSFRGKVSRTEPIELRV